ncbi:TetR/AcrR family transcriptional regulator [Cohnella zeiphila]|uniref:TetR family transcriptional regulator n=1 Tax=Cohnella zeiphila TaxID=2761120 RepID=A0A7X0VZ50_9BACL|nr:TetR family transcriptional regulator [Cohnella zeiphila]MBB6735651.1 TetR family transcriptional regulator [Cohnella zeiphila]
MAEDRTREDRRVRRTRQLLRDGFVDAMREKGFAAVSVQDIADRANVHRGTFYIHYADKYMLLDEVVRENFRRHLAASLPPDAGWSREAVRRLALAVLAGLESKYRHRGPPSRLPVAELELAMREELFAFLREWMEREPACGNAGVPVGDAANVAGWAIFGAALQWSREPRRTPAEQAAEAIAAVVTEGIGQAR